MSSSVSIPRIVGREHELAALSAALDGACSGRAQVTLLTGEPGIGKTSTLSPDVALASEAFLTLITYQNNGYAVLEF
jgi:hypothetical protein